MRAYESILPCVLLLVACGPRQASQEDEADESSAESLDDGSEGSGSSESDAESESGLPPDVPNDPPEGCVPVPFLEPQDRGGGPSTEWSGWMRCEDSFFRLEPVECLEDAPLPSCDPLECEACDAGEQCLEVAPGGLCQCARNCASDSDCGPNEICVCRSGLVDDVLSSLNWCMPADCKGQSDCSALPGDRTPLCRLAFDFCGSPESLYCRTEADDCTYDADCPNHWCRYDSGDERWTCDSPAICE